jgi:hypothetical protein
VEATSGKYKGQMGWVDVVAGIVATVVKLTRNGSDPTEVL